MSTSTTVSQVKNKAANVAYRGDAIGNKLPAPLRFPLVVVLSLTTSSLLYSFFAQWNEGDLSAVSRSLNAWWEVVALVGWRSSELSLGWFLGYDGYDLASLMILSHAPPLYLLTSFYEVRLSTALSSLLIDAAATYIPFRLLRPLSLAHSSSTSKGSVAVPNRELITNLPLQVITTLLSASIISVTLYAANLSFLPSILVTYFDALPSIAAAYSATPISLLPSTLVLGLAAKSFIFTPSTAISPSLGKRRGFNPATASFWETLLHNVWGWDARTKCVIKRTALVAALVSGNTFVQSYMTVEGVEAFGAAAYSGVWAVAIALTGTALGFVGAV